MPLLTPLRAVASFSATRAFQPKPLRFKGQLVDEVGKENKKKMILIDEFIDEFAKTEKLTDQQKYDYRDYQIAYKELNEDLQYGADKKEVTGLMHMSIAQMWQKVPDQYKQLFEQFQKWNFLRMGLLRKRRDPL